MSLEITNILKSSSIVRAVESGTYTINLDDLSSNTEIETVNSANIKRLIWSTNNSITISRNSQVVTELFYSGDIVLTELGYSLTQNSEHPIVINIPSGGTIFLEVTKNTSYSKEIGL